MTESKDLSTAILGKVKESVKALDPEAEVILFGSRARGDARKDSDWDFVILTPNAVTLKVGRHSGTNYLNWNWNTDRPFRHLYILQPTGTASIA